MSRTMATGWGTASVGGAYTASSSKAGSVSNGAAFLSSPAPGSTAAMTLNAVKALDAVSRIDLALPSLPSGTSKVYVRHFLRGTSATSYAAMMMVGSDGSSSIILERIRNGAETKFSEFPGPKLKAGQSFSLAVSAVGTSPVRLGAKVWTVGTSEPSKWSALATDSAADRVTTAGPVGVTVYASKSGTVTPVRFDNLMTHTAPANPVSATPTPTIPTPTPSPTTTPSDYPGQRVQAGAVAPGKQSYSIPTTAIYVATTGSDANNGTKASPLRTISAATKAAGAGGTVVVRGGVYHEEVVVYPHDKLTVEAYPGEAVWLDGSSPVSGWAKSGDVWVKSGWTSFFDASPTYSKGAPDGTTVGWQWIDPDFPMASHPDQIWMDGTALTQVASRDAVTTGTFFVDESTEQLVLGSDPNGRKVEASTLSEGMSIRSKDSLIRGIGVRRYATSVPMMGTVSTYFTGVTLENVTITDNATTGLFVGAAGATLKHVSVRNNGLLGLGTNKADNLTVESLSSQGNNNQHFNRAPVSGAMKISRSRNVTVQNSSFIDNHGQGPWFDESSLNVIFTHNDIKGNKGHGLVFEISEHMTAADNLIVSNTLNGIFVTNSGKAAIWNNTVVGNGGGIDITQDKRRGTDPDIPWVTKDASVVNNIVSQAGGEYVLRVADWSHQYTGAQMVSTSEGNLFHRPSATAPATPFIWALQTSGTTSYANLQTYSTATGHDSTSLLVTGVTPLTSDLALTPQYASRSAFAVPISAEVAEAAKGLSASNRILGATTS